MISVGKSMSYFSHADLVSVLDTEYSTLVTNTNVLMTDEAGAAYLLSKRLPL